MLSPNTGSNHNISSASNLAPNLNVGVPLPPTLEQVFHETRYESEVDSRSVMHGVTFDNSTLDMY